MILVDGAPPEVYPLPRAQIFSTIAKTVIFSKAYKNFKDVFFVKNTGHLPPYEDHNNAIDHVDGKQSLYGLIYSLLENELFILQAYIGKNLANGLIRPFKSLLDTPIIFVLNSNRALRLCIDYRDLNNLTI